MAQILIRDLDPAIVERLKARAQRRGRSLQSEVKHILENAAGYTVEEALEAAARFRKSLGRRFDDSAELIREDRGR